MLPRNRAVEVERNAEHLVLKCFHLRTLLFVVKEDVNVQIAVPGMPIGSPGMEGPNPRPYQVLSFTHAGEAASFATVDPR